MDFQLRNSTLDILTFLPSAPKHKISSVAKNPYPVWFYITIPDDVDIINPYTCLVHKDKPNHRRIYYVQDFNGIFSFNFF